MPRMRTPTKILITSAAGVALTVSAAAPAGAIGIGLGPIVRDPLDLDSTAILGCLEAAPAHLQSHLLDANIVLGTTGDDDFSGDLTSGPDLICGGAGDDVVDLLMDDDVFLGQGGNGFGEHCSFILTLHQRPRLIIGVKDIIKRGVVLYFYHRGTQC